jgi:hypothetical protein
VAHAVVGSTTRSAPFAPTAHSSSARPKSSQPPVVGNSGRPTVVTATAGAGDLAGPGLADVPGAEWEVGSGRPAGGAEGFPSSRLAKVIRAGRARYPARR